MNHKILIYKGIFSFSEALDAGFSRSTITRLARDGTFIKLSRALYKHSEVRIDPQDEEYAIGCSLFGPKSYVGALSALSHWNLTDSAPKAVWMMIPYSRKHKDERVYQSIQTKMSFSAGIIKRKHYRIASAERAILEVLKYEKRFGWSTSINAAREAIRRKMTTVKKLGDMSSKLKLKKLLYANLEAIELDEP